MTARRVRRKENPLPHPPCRQQLWPIDHEGMSASVCCAITSSSSVGMTQTDTSLLRVEMGGPPVASACSSGFTPSRVSSRNPPARRDRTARWRLRALAK